MRAQPTENFVRVDTRWGAALICRPFERLAKHTFTTREWPLGASGLEQSAGPDPWWDVAAALGVAPADLRRIRQVHGSSVVVVRASHPRTSAALSEADIILTDDPTIGLAIQTADCVPLLMADPRTGAVAAAHAGWRGLAAGVPGVAVAAFAQHFDVRPADLVVAMGPSISAACYEVGADVRRQYEATRFVDRLNSWFPKATRPGHWLFDGWQSARDQLVMSGVAAANIHRSELCTFTNADICCSYRRDGRVAGRMAAAIRMREF
jgi:polyphenol oxidase